MSLTHYTAFQVVTAPVKGARSTDLGTIRDSNPRSAGTPSVVTGSRAVLLPPTVALSYESSLVRPLTEDTLSLPPTRLCSSLSLLPPTSSFVLPLSFVSLCLSRCFSEENN